MEVIAGQNDVRPLQNSQRKEYYIPKKRINIPVGTRHTLLLLFTFFGSIRV
jgi:hypothetical protein